MSSSGHDWRGRKGVPSSTNKATPSRTTSWDLDVARCWHETFNNKNIIDPNASVKRSSQAPKHEAKGGTRLNNDYRRRVSSSGANNIGYPDTSTIDFRHSAPPKHVPGRPVWAKQMPKVSSSSRRNGEPSEYSYSSDEHSFNTLIKSRPVSQYIPPGGLYGQIDLILRDLRKIDKSVTDINNHFPSRVFNMAVDHQGEINRLTAAHRRDVRRLQDDIHVFSTELSEMRCLEQDVRRLKMQNTSLEMTSKRALDNLDDKHTEAMEAINIKHKDEIALLRTQHQQELGIAKQEAKQVQELRDNSERQPRVSMDINVDPHSDVGWNVQFFLPMSDIAVIIITAVFLLFLRH